MFVRITRDCIVEGKEYKKGQEVEVSKFVGICMEKVEKEKVKEVKKTKNKKSK